MRPLTTLDALFLRMESARTSGHVGPPRGDDGARAADAVQRLGIVADREQVDDTWSILDGLRRALDELQAVARLAGPGPSRTPAGAKARARTAAQPDAP